MRQHIEADNVGGAERGGPGPADGRAGAGVDFLDGHAELAHQANRLKHGEGADAVGDEIGRVLGAHDALAQHAVAEIAERVEDFGPRGGAGDQLDQLHVARRVEEMRAGPVLLKFGGELGGDLADGQAGGIGGDDGAGAAMGGDAIEQLALDFEIFGDGFDDPIGFGAPGEIVVEIADR